MIVGLVGREERLGLAGIEVPSYRRFSLPDRDHQPLRVAYYRYPLSSARCKMSFPP